MGKFAKRNQSLFHAVAVSGENFNRCPIGECRRVMTTGEVGIRRHLLSHLQSGEIKDREEMHQIERKLLPYRKQFKSRR